MFLCVALCYSVELCEILKAKRCLPAGQKPSK